MKINKAQALKQALIDYDCDNCALQQSRCNRACEHLGELVCLIQSFFVYFSTNNVTPETTAKTLLEQWYKFKNN